MPITTNNLVKGTQDFVKGAYHAGEKTITEILITGMAYSDAITPRDTSNLVNSRFRIIEKLPNGKIQGRAGYNANYALYVHDASGKLAGQPRANGNGTYWSPDAEPQFLKKGFERDGYDEIVRIIKENHKVQNI